VKNIKVIGLGALNMDYLYQVEHILGDGEAVAEDVTASPGGSAANTIYGLAKLEVNTGFVGVVGDDTAGKALIQDFHKVGVDASQIRVKPGAKTGSVLCLSDKLGQRSLYVTPGANSLLTSDDLNLDYINRVGILHLSSFVDDRQFAVLLELMDKLAPSVKLSFAPGTLFTNRGLETITPILARTHVLFLNQTEIKQLTGEDVVSGAQSCLRQGCRIIAVTLGRGAELESGKGTVQRTATAVAYIRDTKNEVIVEPVNQSTVPQVDTTGAGDAFATGFLYGLLKEKALEECGHLGDIVAQFSISQIGAREGLPTLSELAHRYQELYDHEL